MARQADTHETATNAARPPRRRGLLWLVRWVVVVVATVTGAGLMVFAGATYLQHNPDAIGQWQDAASGVKRWGTLVQSLLLAAAVLGWHRIVDWMVAHQWLHESERARALTWRWRLLAFGAAYLLLVVIGPNALWRTLVA